MLGASGQTPLLFLAVFFFLGVLLCWLLGVGSMYGGVCYVIHTLGLRVAVPVTYAKRCVFGFEFSDFEDVRIAPWWKAFTTFATGDPLSKRGIMITLKRRLPFSFSGAMLIGSGSRRVFVPHNESEVFLKELNRAWNRWRLIHGEGQTDPKSGSSTPASNTPRAA